MHDCKDSDIWIATTTVGSRADAERLAGELVGRRLAACVQLDEIRSFYTWDGKACEDAEVRVTIKTTAAVLAELETALASLHPYDVPQFLAWPARASRAYGDWVRASAAHQEKA